MKLMIVESRTKAGEIQKILGTDYKVMPTNGFVKEIIQPKDVPADKKAEYGRYGIRLSDFDEMLSYVPGIRGRKGTGGYATLQAIRKEVQSGRYDTFIAAGDPDDAGASISLQVARALKTDLRKRNMKVLRACWHEITRKAVLRGLSEAQPIGVAVPAADADRARAAYDRLFGYSVSPFLWRVSGGRSGGRAQSPALRLIVNREKERIAFTGVEYWSVTATFRSAEGEFKAALAEYGGRRIAGGSDFDSHGEVKKDGLLVLDDEGSRRIVDELRGLSYRVSDVSESPYTRNPPAPFRTSSMQQVVGSRLHLSSKKIMSIAQDLFSKQITTYLRTDSTSMAPEAVTAARQLVERLFGRDALNPDVRRYREKKAATGGGHECFRPVLNDSTNSFDLPSAIRAKLDAIDAKAFDMYRLVFCRTLASQMRPATGVTRKVTVTSTNGEAVFTATGTDITDKGFLIVYDANL